MSDRIFRTPGVRSGQPAIRGVRITAGDVLGFLAAGMTFDEILGEYPNLSRDDLEAVLEWTQRLIAAATAAYDTAIESGHDTPLLARLWALGRVLGDSRAQDPARKGERWTVLPPEGGHGDWEIHTEEGAIVAQGMSSDTANEIVAIREKTWFYRFEEQNRALRRLHGAARRLLLDVRDGTLAEIRRAQAGLLDAIGGEEALGDEAEPHPTQEVEGDAFEGFPARRALDMADTSGRPTKLRSDAVAIERLLVVGRRVILAVGGRTDDIPGALRELEQAVGDPFSAPDSEHARRQAWVRSFLTYLREEGAIKADLARELSASIEDWDAEVGP